MKLVYTNKNNKGFTLIELLVVISIISLLSSIVLASLTSARIKAKDAAVKAGVAQFVNLFNLNYSDYASYTNLNGGWVNGGSGPCSGMFSGNYVTQARAICNNMYANAANGFGPSDPNRVWISAFGDTYSIMASLNNGNWFCSGSSGAKSEGAYNTGPGCPVNP